MMVFDFENIKHLKTEDFLKILENEDIEFYFETYPKERGIVIGKNLSYLETFGRPRKNHKRYNDWEKLLINVTKLYVDLKETNGKKQKCC